LVSAGIQSIMRIITLNLNGIRSAARKGFFAWLTRQRADVVCLQEIKAQEDQITDAMRTPAGLTGVFRCAEKKGYAGVGLLSRATGQGPHRFRLRRARRRGPLPAGGLRPAQRRVAVPAVGVVRPAPPGLQVPLHGALPAASQEAARPTGAR
jgi:hypothetical protein